MFYIRLMTDSSIELVKRYVKSYEAYFDHFSHDRLLAMAVNPLLVTQGFEDMIALMGDGSGNKIVETAKKLLR